MDAYQRYWNPEWFEEFYRRARTEAETEAEGEDRKSTKWEIEDFDSKNIISGYHIYPIESWWDCKEGLEEYSDFVSTLAVFSLFIYNKSLTVYYCPRFFPTCCCSK